MRHQINTNTSLSASFTHTNEILIMSQHSNTKAGRQGSWRITHDSCCSIIDDPSSGFLTKCRCWREEGCKVVRSREEEERRV